MAETEARRERPSSVGGGEVTVIESPRSPLLHSVLAFAVWIGCIHLCVAAVFTAAFLLPLSLSIAVFAALLLLIVVPVDSDSCLGLKLRRHIFKHVCGYFPITVHVEDYEALVPHRNYIFAFEPHSVLPLGVISFIHLMNLLPLPKFKVLASSAVFRTPFLRHVWTWMGLSSATRKNFTSLLKTGHSCVIIPGGAEEVQHLAPDYETLFLKARKGFIRISIEMGVPLVPVFSFGQSKIYHWWMPSGKLFVQIRKAVKFTPMLFWGAWGTPLAYRIPLHVVIGKPIEVEKNPQPSPEELDTASRFKSMGSVMGMGNRVEGEKANESWEWAIVFTSHLHFLSHFTFLSFVQLLVHQPELRWVKALAACMMHISINTVA